MKFGTKEWSDYSFNIVDGCSHDCKYCYAKTSAIKRGIKTPDNWHIEVVKLPKKIGHKKGVIMFPTQHDITPNTVDACEKAIEDLLKANNTVLVVSKPHFDVVKRIVNKF